MCHIKQQIVWNIKVAPSQEDLVYNDVPPEIIQAFGSNNTLIGV